MSLEQQQASLQGSWAPHDGSSTRRPPYGKRSTRRSCGLGPSSCTGAGLGRATGDRVVDDPLSLGANVGIVRCRSCGEEEDLSGARSGDAIEITCGRCGHTWLRDSTPRCPTCGHDDLREFKEPLIQRARGTAYSVVGAKSIYLCPRCDGDEIARRAPSSESSSAPREDPWK
jgi:hypothetical protein